MAGSQTAQGMPEATCPALNRPLRPSESDDCERVVAVLDETRRVISDGVQWMVPQAVVNVPAAEFA